MCGLTGFLLATRRFDEDNAALARRMADTLVHRGPDDHGVWTDDALGIALAHRRLSIVDLSPAGHQPMVSPSGRYVIAFNGEIYNHLDMRAELQSTAGHFAKWRGHSDTETLLAAVEQWGLRGTLDRAVGMFAIALWDRETHTLSLVRDRLGEKPLYYGWVNQALVFASELKALRVFPGFDNAVERRALALYTRHNYIPAPWSIYENIAKLEPGCFIEFKAHAVVHNRGPSLPASTPNAYWSARDAAESGLRAPFTGDGNEAADEVERLLGRSVAGQMIADVPVGAYLSGGIDSSAVVALMQRQSTRPVRTFTIGFEEARYNEAEHAKAVARHLGTDHTELYVTGRQALDVIPLLPRMFDEPFSDSSQIPTFLVAQLARQHVTVALSGDGGDELFGGYTRYFTAPRVLDKFRRIPGVVRWVAARAIQGVPPTAWSALFQLLRPLTGNRLPFSNPGDKLHKAATLLASVRQEDVYLRLVSHWDPERIVLGAQEPRTAVNDAQQWLKCPDYQHQMMYVDTVSYLPGDILAKVDRTSMAVSLETRVPLLDHRLVEFAWTLPLAQKIAADEGKRVLRDVLFRHVPRSLIERPKMGFGVPLEHWLRGPLRGWAEDLLSAESLRKDGFFDVKGVREKWHEHIGGQRNWHYLLWDVLMFQAWRAGTT